MKEMIKQIPQSYRQIIGTFQTTVYLVYLLLFVSWRLFSSIHLLCSNGKRARRTPIDNTKGMTSKLIDACDTFFFANLSQ